MPTLKLSLERATGTVPDDGRYHVVSDGEILFSSNSQKRAEERYREERDRLFELHGRPEPARVDAEDRERWMRQQRVEFDLRAMNRELADTVVANARRKGGKGR
jgi:hypothetical protein